MSWEERLDQMRGNIQSTFRELGDEYMGTSQKTWLGFEVNTGICRNPCSFHDHGPEPVKPPTFPPAIEEELFQCRLCGEVVTADEIEDHMCLYIKKSLEDEEYG